MYASFTNLAVACVLNSTGDENKSEAKLAEVREFAQGL